jgi:hypothetical protein
VLLGNLFRLGEADPFVRLSVRVEGARLERLFSIAVDSEGSITVQPPPSR